MTTLLRILCAESTGDLFLVFDDNTALELTEDDLADTAALREMNELRRAGHSALKLIATRRWLDSGDRFRILREVPCANCNGTGKEEADAIFALDPDDRSPVFMACAEHGPAQSGLWKPWVVENHVHDCCECHAYGSRIEWTDETITRAELSLGERSAA